MAGAFTARIGPGSGLYVPGPRERHTLDDRRSITASKLLAWRMVASCLL